MTPLTLTRSRIEAIADYAERKQHDPTLPDEVREALVEIRKQSRIAVAALLGREVEQRDCGEALADAGEAFVAGFGEPVF